MKSAACAFASIFTIYLSKQHKTKRLTVCWATLAGIGSEAGPAYLSHCPNVFCPTLSQIAYGTRNALLPLELRPFLPSFPQFLRKSKAKFVITVNSDVTVYQPRRKCDFRLGHAFCISSHVSKGVCSRLSVSPLLTCGLAQKRRVSGDGGQGSLSSRHCAFRRSRNLGSSWAASWKCFSAMVVMPRFWRRWPTIHWK